MTARRERLLVLALGVIGAVLALLAASRTWLTVTVNDPLAGGARLHPSGREAAALVPAAALVALAGCVAAVTMRRVGRFISGLLLVIAGAAIGAATVSVLVHPVDAAADAIRQATGRTGDLAATATAGGWPWVAVVAAVPIVLAGALTIVRGRRWSGLSGRYDAPVAGAPGAGDPAAAAGPDPLDDAWDSLSRGDDPTGPDTLTAEQTHLQIEPHGGQGHDQPERSAGSHQPAEPDQPEESGQSGRP